ncbi:ABC transporter ATP-binding protein [Teredinibacter turnerae]|uniref:ABC transporter ATP-binding protein n=1 Tax=Teredinibacter turnerae TaxID=2426 RepID=UPI0005F887B7|nr:ABC transporter ATP-binding protein [Teredinibacter turnerae]
MSDHIIIKNVSKTFHSVNGRNIKVLNDLNFKIRYGEIVCLLGPSSCGKSTILKILAGLTTYTGSLTISESYPKKIAYVFQKPCLVPWLTVEDNINLVLDVAQSAAHEPASHYLNLAKLDGVEDLYPNELSEGMKARAAIARALSISPNILLCDEPFSSLDELTAMNIRDEIQRIWIKENFSMIFVTHNPLEAAFFSDRVLVLSKKPTNIISEIKIEINRPRNIQSTELMNISKEILNALKGNLA